MEDYKILIKKALEYSGYAFEENYEDKDENTKITN